MSTVASGIYSGTTARPCAHFAPGQLSNLRTFGLHTTVRLSAFGGGTRTFFRPAACPFSVKEWQHGKNRNGQKEAEVAWPYTVVTLITCCELCREVKDRLLHVVCDAGVFLLYLQQQHDRFALSSQ